jgi:hypothetical protein
MTNPLFLIFSLSIGTLLVFCGYVEIYALPALSILVYIYVSILYLNGKVKWMVPLLALGVSVGLHLISLALVPSLICLYYDKFTVKRFVLLLICGTPILYFIARNWGVNFVHPMSELFSVNHLGEFINSQVLAGGLSLILFTVLLIKGESK